MVIEKGSGTGYIIPERETPTAVAAAALDGGHDTALFAQGKLAKEAGEPIEANPIDPAFPPQFDSWVAGWNYGTGPELAPLETDDDAQTSDRHGMAKRSKKGQSADD